MAQRLELHALLQEIIGEGRKVYFQPPPTVKLQYPCIVYKRDDIATRHADNKPYKHTRRYKVTVMDLDPDSDIHVKIGELPMSSYDRFFTADNLNHDVYDLFF